MNNETTISPQPSNNDDDDDVFYSILTYVSLVIIAVGLIGNSISFAIFRFHSQFKTMPSMVYLSFVSITDSLSLLVWNLDHYLLYNLGIKVERLNEPICRISTFDQFFSLQASALILSMVTIDRYFTVIAIPGSFVSKLPFRTARSALIWSLGIISCVALMNTHLLIFSREFEIDSTEKVLFKNDTFNITQLEYSSFLLCYSYKNGFQVSPTWENIHLIIYVLIPFCLMTVFNGLLIKNVLLTSNIHLHHKKGKNNESNGANNKPSASQTKAQSKKKSLTISLVLVTVLFLTMTLPSQIIFGFFYDFFDQNVGRSFLLIVDYLSFANSSSLFFISLLTNVKFRRIVFRKIKEICGQEKEKPNENRKKYLVNNNTKLENAVD